MKKLTVARRRFVFALLLLIYTAFGCYTWAENIDLVTLPVRDGVQLTIYNSEDLTLVREVRTLSFKKGFNRLQFSWANTLIDPTSVEFQPMEKRDQIELIDTVFPGEKPTHLTWNINSGYEGQIKVLVTYFISGLTWNMDYTLISNPEETELDFDGHITVVNRSGEDFEEAGVRVIVGKINLIEKIAILASKRGIPVPQPSTRGYDRLKKDAVRNSIDDMDGIGWGAAPPRSAIPMGTQVVKEQISDYFIFTVSGTENIPNGTTKRMKAIEAEHVTFDIVYRMRDYQYGLRPVRFLIWTNDKEHKLGTCPLPDGMLRLFQENGHGLSFLAGKKISYVPVKAEVEINLGNDDLVVYKSHKLKTKRSAFEFRKIERTQEERVIGWNEEQTWVDSVRNYHNKPIKFELRRIWRGDVKYRPNLTSTLFDYQTVETIFTVEASSKKELNSTAELAFGSKKKQDSVDLR